MELTASPNYEGEYKEAKKYADNIGRKYASMIHRPALWEDFSQEYLAIYFNPAIIKNAIRDDGSIISNLAGFIATRKLISYIRKHYLDSPYNAEARLVYVGDPSYLDKPTPSTTIDDIITGESIDYATYLLSTLRGKLKPAMQLIYIQGMSQKEASARLGVTESAISLRRARALKILKRMATI